MNIAGRRAKTPLLKDEVQMRWQSSWPNPYDGGRYPHRSNEDLSDKTPAKRGFSAGRAAPAAFLHQARHHGIRRLRLAKGRELAGSAARSRRAGCEYPQISRGGERLYREPARPYRFLAEEAGCGNARADQGRRFQRAVAGWSVCLFPQV